MTINDISVFLKQKVLGDQFKNLLMKLLFPFRNSFILFNITAKAKKDRVNLNYWWEKPNLGDDLSRVIVEHMLSLRGISLDKPVHGRKHLYAVGSIITAGIQDCTVWGSGVLFATMLNRVKGRKLDIRSVRGPVTRILLIDMGYKVPEVYGDPVIILPEIYKPDNAEKKYKYGVIIHKDQKFSSKEDEKFISRNDVLLIDIRTRDYRGFVDKVVSCEKVISSSLHGIIIAESYGVPAMMHQPTVEPLLKYCDWYYSTGRYTFPIAKKLVEISETEPPSSPCLHDLREKQKAVFPYDLYEC